MEKVPFKSKHWLQIAPFLLCTQAIAEPVTSKADTDNDVIVMTLMILMKEVLRMVIA
ncbi:hypothetical protein ACAC16_003447 [Escherichia albertii]